MTIRSKKLFLLCLPLCFITAGSARAQTPPPLPQPAINYDTHIRQVSMTNSEQVGAPVAISGTVQVGRRSYGNGEMKLTNSSGKAILAVHGVWAARTREGVIAEQGWNVGGATSLWLGDLGEGKPALAEVPIAGPISPVATGEDRVQQVSCKVTGVVFADGTGWGDGAPALTERVRSEAQIMLLVAERLLSRCQKTPSDEFVRQIQTAPLDPKLRGISLFPNEWNQIIFKFKLIKPDNTLRSDAVQWLNKAIDSLKTFL